MTADWLQKKYSRRRFLITTGEALMAFSLAGCLKRRSDGTGIENITSSDQAGSQASSGASNILPGVPDTIVHNGKVYVVDTGGTISQAISIKDGNILGWGTNDAILATAGPETQAINVGGRTITPGLIDPHAHVSVMGLTGGYYIPFLPPDVTNIAEMQAYLAELLAQKAEGEWLYGYYLAFQEARLPTRYELDVASPKHPVLMLQQGGHFGVANSLALQIAGIDASTPNPVGGIIEKDSSGEPTGALYNHRALDLVRRYMPPLDQADVEQGIASTLPLLAACGITQFHDNNIRGLDSFQSYRNVGKSGNPVVAGNLFYTLEWPSDLDKALNQVEYFSDANMRFAGFKFLIDGQLPTAYCYEPHGGISYTTTTWDPADYKNAVRALHDTGYQISTHCMGDAAVDLALDAYEEAMNANPRPDPRHRIEHLIITKPESTQRMKDLGVIASCNPHFIRLSGNIWVNILGEERAERIIVTREWLEEGVALTIGSDLPTTPWYVPQMTMACSITRTSPTNVVIGSEQRLTFAEALRAHTMGAAYATHDEATRGSLEPGKRADLAVWGGNPEEATPAELAVMGVDMTMINGEIVHQV